MEDQGCNVPVTSDSSQSGHQPCKESSAILDEIMRLVQLVYARRCKHREHVHQGNGFVMNSKAEREIMRYIPACLCIYILVPVSTDFGSPEEVSSSQEMGETVLSSNVQGLLSGSQMNMCRR